MMEAVRAVEENEQMDEGKREFNLQGCSWG